MLLFTSLRDGKCHTVQIHVQLERYDDFAGFALVSFPHFHNTQLKQFFLCFVQSLLVFEGECLVDATVGDVEVVDVTGVFVHFNGEYIHIMNNSVHCLALCTIAFNQVVLLLDGLCFLEFHFHRQCLHFIHQEVTYDLSISFQNLFDFIDVSKVFFVCLLSDARAFAVLDVVFQAYTELPVSDVFGSQSMAASAKRIQFFDQFQQSIHRWNVAVWAIISRTVSDDVPCLENAWKVFVAHADGRVGLVVLQQDIVARSVFFDEIVFQQECIFLGFNDDIADVCYLADQHSCLSVRVFPIEIGRDSSFQVFRLSNINDGSFSIQILVNTGAFRQIQYNAFQVFVGVDLFLFHRIL